MTEEDRQQWIRDHFAWCREMYSNAQIAIAGAESGNRLVVIDQDGNELDITAPDLALNQRSVLNITQFLLAHGESVVA